MVSIIMPVWNQLEYTKKAIDSINKYTHIPFELIIVDNGSSDGTAEYISSLKNVSIISNKENLGWCVALNQGLKQAKGEYVMFINNDIEVYENWLEKMLIHFKGNVGAVGPTSDFVMGMQKYQLNNAYIREQEAYYLIGFCFLTKKEVLEKIKLPDGKIIKEKFIHGSSEEIDLCFRIREAGYKIVIARDVFIHHEGSKSFEKLFNSAACQGAHMEHIKKNDRLLRDEWGNDYVNKWFVSKKQLAIGIPTVGLINHKFLENFWGLEKPQQTLLVVSPRSMVHEARNKIVDDVLKHDPEYLLFLDDDTIVEDDLVYKLMSHNVDIVAPLIYRRTPPYYPCAFVLRNDKAINIENVNDGLVEVDVVGFGATLIKTEVFKKLNRPWFYHGEMKNGVYNYLVGEDFNFCKNAKKAGYHIYCDTSIQLGHIGEERIITQIDYLNDKLKK